MNLVIRVAFVAKLFKVSVAAAALFIAYALFLAIKGLL